MQNTEARAEEKPLPPKRAYTVKEAGYVSGLGRTEVARFV